MHTIKIKEECKNIRHVFRLTWGKRKNNQFFKVYISSFFFVFHLTRSPRTFCWMDDSDGKDCGKKKQTIGNHLRLLLKQC